MSEELERNTLRTEGLVKIYGKRTVVNDVSFTVTQGEIVGLLQDSWCLMPVMCILMIPR